MFVKHWILCFETGRDLGVTKKRRQKAAGVFEDLCSYNTEMDFEKGTDKTINEEKDIVESDSEMVKDKSSENGPDVQIRKYSPVSGDIFFILLKLSS